MLHHCSAVKPATRASGSRTCVAHGCARPFPGCWCGKLCSAACGLGPCAFAPPMHCPGSDPGAREAPAGMWNLTSLRAARACRKLGRVAPRTLPADGRLGLGARDRGGRSRREKVGLHARWSGVSSEPNTPSRRQTHLLGASTLRNTGGYQAVKPSPRKYAANASSVCIRSNPHRSTLQPVAAPHGRSRRSWLMAHLFSRASVEHFRVGVLDLAVELRPAPQLWPREVQKREATCAEVDSPLQLGCRHPELPHPQPADALAWQLRAPVCESGDEARLTDAAGPGVRRDAVHDAIAQPRRCRRAVRAGPVVPPDAAQRGIETGNRRLAARPCGSRRRRFAQGS
jgi:hypothetical protein